MRFGTAVPIASGATGRVVRAFDSERGCDVALKLLHRDDPLWVQRMLREAEVQARLVHPHICEVFGTGQLGEQPYIAMRLVEGETLDEAVRGSSDRDKAAVLAQVADAIAYAHRQGVVHRDLKPSNILVERRGDARHAVVVDFGLVRDVDAPDLTRTGQLLGTPGYMAPEQATAAGKVDGRADIFSLGVIAFEVFAGRRPFLGESAAEILVETLRRDAPSLGALRPDLDPALVRIVRQCLESDPAWRYQDADALRADLLAFRDGRKVAARPDSPLRRAARFSRRHPWRAGLGAAAALSLAAVVGTALWSAWYAREQALAAQRYTEFAGRIENAMRLEWMKPSHDVAPARTRLRESVADFAAALPARGPAALRSGRLAAGRAFAALGERERARAELVAALDAGEDAPELHAALGRLLMQDYFGSLQGTAVIENDELRLLAMRQLDTRYRQPSLVHLREAAEAGEQRDPELEALVLWLEGKDADASGELAEVAGQLSWPVDTLLLAADIATADALTTSLQGKREQAYEAWRIASARYRSALEIARSHAGAAAGLCRVVAGFSTLRRHGLHVPAAVFEEAAGPCVHAPGLDSADSTAHSAVAYAEAEQGRLRRSLNDWDETDFARGLSAARRALALEPAQPAAQRALGALLAQRAHVAVDNGDHSAPATIDEAIGLLSAAQARDPRDANGAMLLANAHLVAARAAAMDARDRMSHLLEAERVLERAADAHGAPLVLELHLIENQTWRGFETYTAGKDPGEALERAVERARRLYAQSPQHAQVAPALGLAAWTLADFQLIAGNPDPQVAQLAVDAYRHALRRDDVSFADLFNAVGALHLLATQRLDAAQSAAEQVAEMRVWVQRLSDRAGSDERIDIQLASLHHIAARELVLANGNAASELEDARRTVDRALANPVDRREALELALQIETLAARLGEHPSVLDRLPALEAGVSQHPDQPRALAALARLLTVLPPDGARRDKARQLLRQAVARMPFLAGSYQAEVRELQLDIAQAGRAS